MNKIPTAKKFLSDNTDRVAIPWIDNDIEDNSPLAQSILTCMKEFAKLHVEAALKAANEAVTQVWRDKEPWPCEQSILSAYSLNKII